MHQEDTCSNHYFCRCGQASCQKAPAREQRKISLHLEKKVQQEREASFVEMYDGLLCDPLCHLDRGDTRAATAKQSVVVKTAPSLLCLRAGHDNPKALSPPLILL